MPARPDLLQRSQVVPVPRRMLSATRESQSEISVLLGRSSSVQTSLPGDTAFGRAVPPGEGSMGPRLGRYVDRHGRGERTGGRLPVGERIDEDEFSCSG